MKKDNVIVIRVTKQEKERLIKKSQEAEMSLSEYLIEQGLERDIIIIEDVKNFVHELRKIGNNINQLTYLANSGAIRTVYLDGFKEDMKEIWTELNDIWLLKKPLTKKQMFAINIKENIFLQILFD